LTVPEARDKSRAPGLGMKAGCLRQVVLDLFHRDDIFGKRPDGTLSAEPTAGGYVVICICTAFLS
jgi:hypothetical protein